MKVKFTITFCSKQSKHDEMSEQEYVISEIRDLDDEEDDAIVKAIMRCEANGGTLCLGYDDARYRKLVVALFRNAYDIEIEEYKAHKDNSGMILLQAYARIEFASRAYEIKIIDNMGTNTPNSQFVMKSMSN